jgi:hypothetical protein
VVEAELAEVSGKAGTNLGQSDGNKTIAESSL